MRSKAWLVAPVLFAHAFVRFIWGKQTVLAVNSLSGVHTSEGSMLSSSSDMYCDKCVSDDIELTEKSSPSSPSSPSSLSPSSFFWRSSSSSNADTGAGSPWAAAASARNHRVTKFSPNGSVCCACAQRPGLRARVNPASSPASHCKQCSVLTSPSSTRAAAPVPFAHAVVTTNILFFQWVQN
jgi:hypothetical protein